MYLTVDLDFIGGCLLLQFVSAAAVYRLMYIYLVRLFISYMLKYIFCPHPYRPTLAF